MRGWRPFTVTLGAECILVQSDATQLRPNEKSLVHMSCSPKSTYFTTFDPDSDSKPKSGVLDSWPGRNFTGKCYQGEFHPLGQCSLQSNNISICLYSNISKSKHWVEPSLASHPVFSHSEAKSPVYASVFLVPSFRNTSPTQKTNNRAHGSSEPVSRRRR